MLPLRRIWLHYHIILFFIRCIISTDIEWNRNIIIYVVSLLVFHLPHEEAIEIRLRKPSLNKDNSFDIARIYDIILAPARPLYDPSEYKKLFYIFLKSKFQSWKAIFLILHYDKVALGYVSHIESRVPWVTQILTGHPLAIQWVQSWCAKCSWPIWELSKGSRSNDNNNETKTKTNNGVENKRTKERANE